MAANTRCEDERRRHILQLASAIKEAVVNIVSRSAEAGLSLPSFDEDAVHCVSERVSQEIDTVLDATAELHDLFTQPRYLIYRNCGYNNAACLRAIAEFQLAAKVPARGQISFRELAENSALTERMATRLVRHAITMRIFREPQPGFVAHTAASKMLVNPTSNDWLLAVTKDMWPAACQFVDALQKWPESEEPGETAFSLSKHTKQTLYELYTEDPERSTWLARGMAAFSKLPQFDVGHILDHYRWDLLGDGDGLVVDMGGSHGHVAFQLAQRFGKLRVLVQDLDTVVATATVPQELEGRVSFMAHDFFAVQPVAGADVYFMRLIMHNWSDAYCLRILASLLPALRHGSRVVIQENIMPDYGSGPLWRERKARVADISAAIYFNAAERTVAEFEALFSQTHPGFALQQVIKPFGSQLALLEFTWHSEGNDK